MDVRLTQRHRPVYADLDGTVIKSDLLWETLFMLARQTPESLWRVPLWMAAGKARLKAELANRIEFDASLLPYREEVIAELARAQAEGRRTVLATGANEKLAHAVSTHLGVFDEVMASSETVNLTAEAKLDRIRREGDREGFDYLGNSHEDICLLEAATEPTVVAPDREARRWQRRTGAHLVGAGDRSRLLRDCLKAMRPHQWAKNTLVFVPLVLAHDYTNVMMILEAIVAFVAFSFAASSVYIVNDLLDLDADRRHRTKRHRPFASGAVPIPIGVWLATGLLTLAVALGTTLGLGFQAVLAGYLVLTTAYSFALKRMLLVDVLALAALYTIRAIAGGAAMGIELSFWLMAFSSFFFLSLALVKRFTELAESDAAPGRKIVGRSYRASDLEAIGQAGMTAGFASVLVLALYLDSPEVREINNLPWLLWPLCPLVLYMVVRIWILARRNEMHEDPVVFLLHDWRSQMMIAFGAALFAISAYV
ncbi:prenyltransferase UbiA [Aureimonas endophytica]|uniref:Prenyltransferase UbiA n=1 Tax=Aureimonas endophytica TaxID=2027858 RepID=A0A916ZBP5_9HYPH|nr:UbiA family prenyltransferase [Aureimonas endophytica]GGD86516.1 prenyltransferase UbiA [Aureimonas endophytica]